MMAMVLVGSFALSLVACENGNKDTAQQQSALVTADDSYKSFFKTSVFLGDSITEGLSNHDMLDESNVIGLSGGMALSVFDQVNEIAKRKPDHIFILLGQCDLLWPVVDHPIAYSMSQYSKLIKELKAKVPAAQIAVLSVTPVTADAEKEEPRYKHINEYNQALKKLAANEKVKYIDLSPLFEKKNSDQYDSDGIHFKPTFYKKWLEYMKGQIKIEARLKGWKKFGIQQSYIFIFIFAVDPSRLLYIA